MPAAAVKRQVQHDDRLQKQLLRHAGKWVATTDSKLIAVGNTAPEAYHKAQEAGHSNPVIFRVPEKDATYFF